MPREQLTFRELLEAAAKPHKELWRGEQLNLGAISRRFEKKGYRLSEASLSRILRGLQGVGPDTVEAVHGAFGIPKSLLRGEPMSADVEKLLTDYKLSTLLLAKKLESLPKESYYAISEQIEREIERERQLQDAYRSGNVTPIDRAKR